MISKKKKRKKKRSSPKLRLLFRPISQIQTFEGGCFRMGGLFSIFHIKSASKAQKACDFAYFKSQWGGLEPPRPPPPPPWLRYCTRLYISRYFFIPTNPRLVAMSFFFSFSFEISYAHFLNGIKQNKVHQICYCYEQTMQTKLMMYNQCKQNSRDFSKKFWFLSWTPKDFEKSTHPSLW